MARVEQDDDILRNVNIRLCRLCTWSNYKGFGFYIIKCAKPPFVINLIESHSPAAACGLQIWDIIIAINNKNVLDMNYSQMISILNKVKKSSNHPLELLVVEARFYTMLKEKNIEIDSSVANICETPIDMPDDYKNFFKNRTPRLCHIRLNSKDLHFGFDVVNGNNEIGIHVQDVILNSPAYRVGLRKFDRIIEIDDQYIDRDRSKSIVEKLNRAVMKRYVKLLVVDTQTYEYYISYARKIKKGDAWQVEEQEVISSVQTPNYQYMSIENPTEHVEFYEGEVQYESPDGSTLSIPENVLSDQHDYVEPPNLLPDSNNPENSLIYES